MTSVDLAEFARDAQAHADRIEETKTPEILTVGGGRPKLVVLDAADYEAMREKVEKTEVLDSLRQALRDSDAGKGRDAEELFAELDAKYGA